MKLTKANTRDKKRNQRRYGHRTSGRSVFTIQQAQVKRAKEIKEGKNG